MQGRLLHARPSVCSMQGRLFHAGTSAPCRAVCSTEGRLFNAGPSAQRRAVSSTQGSQLNPGRRLLRGGRRLLHGGRRLPSHFEFSSVSRSDDSHGSQGMEFHSGTFRLVRDHPRTTTSFCSVVQGKGKDDVGPQVRSGASSPQGRVRCAVGRWNKGDRVARSAKVRSLVGALAALGPEELYARMEIEGALKRAEADSTPNRVDPDARVDAARDRVARLEQAIAAMGNFLGPEMDVLVASSKKAQKESQELPLDAQIRAREDFIERAKKRIDHFDLERAAEVQRMEESQKRLAELRALQGAQSAIPPTIDASAEVSRLQQMVDVQRQFPIPQSEEGGF